MVVADKIRSTLLLIGGDQVESLSGETHENLDPSSGDLLAVVSKGGVADIDRAVAAAREAFEGIWSDITPEERSRLLLRIAGRIHEQADELASLECLDSGKPLSQARGDVKGAARAFEYYGGIADKLHGTTIPVQRGLLAYTVRDALGVSAQIVPWNFPIAMSSRGVAPALAAGNTVVLKPALEAPMTPIRLGELAIEAGLPPGVLNVVPGDGSEAGARLAGHPDVNHVTFTGSVETGIAVMKAAAQNVVPVLLELGGKSPSLVFEDADVDAVVASVGRSAFLNAGQSCSAGSLLLVERSAHDRVVDAFNQRAQGMTLGPGIEDPDMGPLITQRQLERVLGYLELARDEGALPTAGGDRPDDPRLHRGYFVKPTVLDQVTSEMRVAREEIFGPVLAVTVFDNLDEAAAEVNRAEYGLAAGIWTRDLNRAHDMAARLRAGQVFVNTFGGGNIQLPFGGYRKSGFGRLRGLEALDEFTQVKNVCVQYS